MTPRLAFQPVRVDGEPANSSYEQDKGTIMKSLAATATSLLLAASVASAEPDNGITVTPAGSQPSTHGSAENFTGSVPRRTPGFKRGDPARVGGGIVPFEPGAHTAWHTRPLGQTLIVIAGVGLVQHWDGPIQEIQTRRCRLGPARCEALARSRAHDRNDAYRDRGGTRREGGSVDGEGLRRAVSRLRSLDLTMKAHSSKLPR